MTPRKRLKRLRRAKAIKKKTNIVRNNTWTGGFKVRQAKRKRKKTTS